jgi:hypothetical protein
MLKLFISGIAAAVVLPIGPYAPGRLAEDA